MKRFLIGRIAQLPRKIVVHHVFRMKRNDEYFKHQEKDKSKMELGAAVISAVASLVSASFAAWALCRQAEQSKEDAKERRKLEKQHILSLPLEVKNGHIETVMDLLTHNKTRLYKVHFDAKEQVEGYLPNKVAEDGSMFFEYADTVLALCPKWAEEDPDNPGVLINPKLSVNPWYRLTGYPARRPFHFDDVETAFSNVLLELARFEQLAAKYAEVTEKDIPIRIRRLVDILSASEKTVYKPLRHKYAHVGAAVHKFIGERPHLSGYIYNLFRRVDKEWEPVPWTMELANRTVQEYHERVALQKIEERNKS